MMGMPQSLATMDMCAAEAWIHTRGHYIEHERREYQSDLRSGERAHGVISSGEKASADVITEAEFM